MANVMQTLSDLAALAKAGFKAEELKEIIAQTKDDNILPKEVPETAPKEETQPDVQTDQNIEQTQDELKYKQLYEDAHKEIESLKKDIASIQQANVSRDVSNTTKAPQGQEAINAMFRNILN